MRGRRRFSKEYKVEAVELSRLRGVAEASRSLGIEQSLLNQWKKKLEVEGTEAFRGNGNRTPLEEETRRLRLEKQRLKEEQDILKKAAAYFAKHQR